MYQLTLKTRKQLERATLRAQAEKLKMEEVTFGFTKYGVPPATFTCWVSNRLKTAVMTYVVPAKLRTLFANIFQP
jgi:hypothetical protein